MSRGEFRLASLLRLRESQRDERRSELADAQDHERQLATRRAELDHCIDHSRQSRAPTVGTVDLDRLRAAQSYETLLRRERDEVELRHIEATAAVETRRAALVAADQEVRALEKLRERQATAEHATTARREVQSLDEVAARQHRWQSRGS